MRLSHTRGAGAQLPYRVRYRETSAVKGPTVSSDLDSVNADPAPSDPLDTAKANLVLALCFVGFLLTFWAWALMGPLGATYKEDLGLSSFQQSLVVALPVVVGSLGRIPVGALTDRLGGRTAQRGCA